MTQRSIHPLPAFAALLILSAPLAPLQAQIEHLPYQLKYDQGQTIQPIFQGWSRNPDGSFDMHFGYLNRNYTEEVNIPIGPDNVIDMAGLDRLQNQPTYFHSRDHRDIFTVNVPADFGNRKIVWQLTSQGETLQAVGWLQAEWEIDEYGGYTPEPEVLANQPPTLTIDTAASVTLPAKLTLTATVTDDDLPKREAATGGNQERTVNEWNRTPLLTRAEDALELPTNVPHLKTAVSGNKIRPTAPKDKLTVNYSVWRGPANITTQPQFSEVKNGTATTQITFTEPGEYQLRVQAFDGGKSSYAYVTVNVR